MLMQVHAHTHFLLVIPPALSFWASNQNKQPLQRTPQKQFGSQLAVEVVNNRQKTEAGAFAENLTPYF